MLYKYARWPLYKPNRMRWRDRAALPFACVAFVVLIGVLHVAGALPAAERGTR